MSTFSSDEYNDIIYLYYMNNTFEDDVFDVTQLLKRAGVATGMSVADLGVGRTAVFSLTAARIVSKTGKVFAADVVKDVLHIVETKAQEFGIENIITVWTDLELYGAAKRIIDSSIDVAILANTLYQSQKKAEILREATRMLKPGGRLFILDWKPIQTSFGPPIENRVHTEEIKKCAI